MRIDNLPDWSFIYTVIHRTVETADTIIPLIGYGHVGSCQFPVAQDLNAYAERNRDSRARGTLSLRGTLFISDLTWKERR